MLQYNKKKQQNSTVVRLLIARFQYMAFVCALAQVTPPGMPGMDSALRFVM